MRIISYRCKINLFNDKFGNARQGFYIKTYYAGREQDSGETERERECKILYIAGNERWRQQ